MTRGSRIGQWVIPDEQRKSRADLVTALDVSASSSRRSAFWIMLLLSALIATAGVVADSTATVIGAMIIAPLATPIMGIALGLVLRDRPLRRRSGQFVARGLLLVVALGVAWGLALPGSFDVLTNSQVTGRTTPTLVDLVAAIATGFAGAVGLARRDVSDVLPGVAIAISLVPPLAVVGVCIGAGHYQLAFGASLLFVSNVVAMILAGMAIFALLLRTEVVRERGANRRAYTTVALGLVTVLLLLGINTAASVAIGVFEGRVSSAATMWLSDTQGGEVRDVSFVSGSIVVEILTPDEPPSVSELERLLRGRIPAGIDIVIESIRGERVDLGPNQPLAL